MMRQTVLAPFSPYAEAIRGLRIRLTRTREGRREVSVLGCASALPGEGKRRCRPTSRSSWREAGFRTLLIDGDLRKRTLSKTLAPACRAGFVDVMAEKRPLDEVLWHDAYSKLAFLPAAAVPAGVGVPNLAGSQAQALLGRLRSAFDFIVIDLPAILPVADAAAASSWSTAW